MEEEREIDSITYIISPSCYESFQLKGFDFVMGINNQSECGITDPMNKIIYSTFAQGEVHKHEIANYLSPYFPKAHGLIFSGLVSYFGDSTAHLGKPLEFHFKKVNKYLQSNPDLNLEEFLNFTYFD